jgi:quaternary ammonium compound-resistance protein SugE
MDKTALAWLYLLVASGFEAGWAIGLKQSHGFSRLWPSVWTVIAMILSFAFLAAALRHLPVGTAYAVWTGIGAAAVGMIGIVFLGEPATVMRVMSLALIVAGVFGLRFFSLAP